MNCTKYYLPKQRTLNFSACKSLGEIHLSIQQELDLPDWYGQNLDALWDALTGMMYVPAEVSIIFKPKTKQSEELREAVEEIIAVFEEATQKYNEITLQTDI